MAKIYSPNKGYTGVVADVPFNKGVGETKNQWLINWFKEKGYTVEIEEVTETEQEKKLREEAEVESKVAEELAAAQAKVEEEEKKSKKGSK